MENGDTNDLAMYKDMAQYDFTKPFYVSLTVEQMHDGIVNPTDIAGNRKIQFELEKWYNRNNSQNINNRKITQQNIHNHSEEVRKTYLNQNLSSNQNTQNKSLPRISPTVSHQIMELPFQQTAIKNVNLSSSVPIFNGLFSSRNTENKFYDIDVSVLRSLNLISINLIRTLQAFSYYLSIINTSGSDYAKINDASTKYFNERQYYFNRCRDLAIRLLLPRSDNISFVKAFLEETRNIAKHDLKFNCAKKDVQTIYNAFIMWIKYNKETVPQNSETISCVSTQVLNNIPQTNTQLHHIDPNYGIYNNIEQRRKISDETRNHDAPVKFGIQILKNINNQYMLNVSPENETRNNTNLVTRVNQSTNFLNTEISQLPYREVLGMKHNPRRSSSRDSGFMSPDNELTINVCSEDQIQNTAIQNATYAPTLNTNIGRAQIGACRICGSETELTCTGCNDHYYCGTVCQALEWSKHNTICGRR